MIETASWGRRILALFVDWLASTLVVMLFVGGPAAYYSGSGSSAASFSTLGVFILESTVLIALAGGSFGQLATRLRVVRYDGSGRPLDLLRALLRQVMIALVVPPLIYKPDGRGLHDLATGSATVRLQ